MEDNYEYYGGMGWDAVPYEEGRFQIKFESEGCQCSIDFKTLEGCKVAYEAMINTDKAAWDMNTIPELIECHTLKVRNA